MVSLCAQCVECAHHSAGESVVEGLCVFWDAQAAEKKGAPVLGADTNPFLLQPLWEDQPSTEVKPDGCVDLH